MNILLVFEVIPETTTIYKLEGLDAETAQRIKNCAGKFLNVDESPDLDWLNEFIFDPDGQQRKGLPETTVVDLSGEWSVVITGFAM